MKDERKYFCGTVLGNVERTDWMKWNQPTVLRTAVRLDSGQEIEVYPNHYTPGDRVELAYNRGLYIVIGKLPF